MPEELKRGSIILAKLDDHSGKVSEHFAVVLTSSADIHRGATLVVAGISTSFRQPLPTNWFVIDHIPGGRHPMTGMSEACVVKADWLDSIDQADVIEVRGRTTARIVRQLLAWLNA